MDDVFVLNSNSCCNALVKVSCWLILAKYRASKLEVVKRVTEDASLDEFETRLYLRTYYANCASNSKFLDFTQKVYNKSLQLISDYICSPDWSIFYDEGNCSIWQLKTIIQNEIIMASCVFNIDSHSRCCQLFYRMKEQILSIIDSWSSSNYVYNNYISASLSDIFTDKMKKIVHKYEKHPNNFNLRWLCDDLMSNCGHDRWDYLQLDEDKSQLWFINETINLHYIEEPFVPYSHTMQSEEEFVLTLSYWLFRESINQLRINTRQLVQYNEYQIPSNMQVFYKNELAAFLDTSLVNLELRMKVSAHEGVANLDVSEGPHYFMSNASIVELHSETEMSADDYCIHKYDVDHLQPLKVIVDESESTNSLTYEDEKSNFDLIDSILTNKQDFRDTEYKCKLTDIKEELEELYVNDSENDSKCATLHQEDNVDKVMVPKLQIKARHELQKSEKTHDMYPAVQHKKRGRPKKIDDYSNNGPKNGQHKYSPEDVQDCSIWISDNFYEVAGNKPAIDRARMYELYTNYCLLKLCTPVDRALFGKIIRKVFPKLKSRRLIQNQVLKYHYVGLKPKFAELEQALLYSDSSFNPSEILVTYTQVEE